MNDDHGFLDEDDDERGAPTTARGLLPRGFDGVDVRIPAVPADRWESPSPCEGWTVRDVVNHLVSEHLWVPHLLSGETIEQVGDRYSGDVLGSDPVGAWRRASSASRAAWAGLASDGVIVNLSFGDAPAGEYAAQMLLDLVVHGWDVARGAGLDERMDEDCVRHSLTYATPRADTWRRSGIFGPRVEISDAEAADPQSRLLAITGRRP